MPLNEAQKESPLDDAISESTNLKYSQLEVAKTKTIEEPAVLNPLTMEDMPSRGTIGIASTCNLLDFISNYDRPLDTEAIRTHVEEKRFDLLPEVLRSPAGATWPQRTVTQVVIQQKSNGKHDIIKQHMFPTASRLSVVARMCLGTPCCLLYRRNTWGLKKAWRTLLDRMPGFHIYYETVEAPTKDAAGSGKKGWEPTAEEVKAGFDCINKYQGEFAANVVLQWVVEQTKTPGGKMFGWPMHIVEKAMANKQKEMEAAQTQTFFALNSYDAKTIFQTKIFPLIWATCLYRGLFLVGHPGKGKTPIAMILAMACGRFNVRRMGLERAAGFRRGKQFDAFKAQPGEVQTSILLDDPAFEKILIEDLLSMGDSGEEGHSDCRYAPVKWAKNQFKVILSNRFQPDKEPPATCGQTIDHTSFMELMGHPFGDYPSQVELGFYKRFVTIIAGDRAIYVRHPSEHPTQSIYVFTEDDVVNDWMLPDNSEAYSAWKKGEKIVYDGFEQRVQQEQAIIDSIY